MSSPNLTEDRRPPKGVIPSAFCVAAGIAALFMVGLFATPIAGSGYPWLVLSAMILLSLGMTAIGGGVSWLSVALYRAKRANGTLY